MSKIFDIIDTESVEQLADILNKKDLGEITVEYEGKSVCVKSKRVAPPPPPAPYMGGMMPQTSPMPAVSPAVSQPNSRQGTDRGNFLL